MSKHIFHILIPSYTLVFSPPPPKMSLVLLNLSATFTVSSYDSSALLFRSSHYDLALYPLGSGSVSVHAVRLYLIFCMTLSVILLLSLGISVVDSESLPKCARISISLRKIAIFYSGRQAFIIFIK